MRSALYCLEKAAQCEALADETGDEASRTVLRATARHWHTLGHAARLAESGEGLVAQMLRARPGGLVLSRGRTTPGTLPPRP